MKYVVGYAIAFALCWLLGGFVVLDWDVRNWDNFGRFTLIYLAFLGLPVAGLSKNS